MPQNSRIDGGTQHVGEEQIAGGRKLRPGGLLRRQEGSNELLRCGKSAWVPPSTTRV